MKPQPVEAEEIAVILDALSSKPTTKNRLSVVTGISVRQVERVIEHIRRESIALVASSSSYPPGYWLPASLTEAEENIERRHSRAIRQMSTLTGERALIARMREVENPRPTLWAVSA